jgi:pimeloyl-ACP methyl ester carboxylesterase
MMHPKKRVLQPYHYDWLEHSLKHGISIKKHVSKNEIPYLMVTQNRTEKLSKRQEIFLKQLGRANLKKQKGTLVLLHGKNGQKEDLLPVAERYVTLGFSCLLIDLPCHGESKIETLYYGTKAYEQHYVDEVLDDASHYIALDKPLAIWGISLGGAFAITNVAHSKHQFNAMVLVSTFDRLDSVLKGKSINLFGEVLGTLLYEGLDKSLALFYDFDPSLVNSAQITEKLELPLYMVHGKRDKLIGYKQGQNLFWHFASKSKKIYLDEEGDHHNILVTKHQFYKESGLFLLGER